jgi:hypothetical protein
MSVLNVFTEPGEGAGGYRTYSSYADKTPKTPLRHFTGRYLSLPSRNVTDVTLSELRIPFVKHTTSHHLDFKPSKPCSHNDYHTWQNNNTASFYRIDLMTSHKPFACQVSTMEAGVDFGQQRKACTREPKRRGKKMDDCTVIKGVRCGFVVCDTPNFF